LHNKDCQQNILHGILLGLARGIPVGTHTCIMPPCGLIDIVIGLASQGLNIATGRLTTLAHCYCDIFVKMNRACLPFTSLHKKILSIESSPLDHPSTHSSVQVGTGRCPHVPCCECKEKGKAGSCYTPSIKSYCCWFIRWSM
jgi:hypothetical protein